jgi:hypothetical protein
VQRRPNTAKEIAVCLTAIGIGIAIDSDPDFVLFVVKIPCTSESFVDLEVDTPGWRLRRFGELDIR